MEASACACAGMAKSSRPRAKRASFFIVSFLSGTSRVGKAKPPEPVRKLNTSLAEAYPILQYPGEKGGRKRRARFPGRQPLVQPHAEARTTAGPAERLIHNLGSLVTKGGALGSLEAIKVTSGID